jgi:hypothetical protein
MAKLGRGGLLNPPGTPGASGGVNYLKGMNAVMVNLNKEIELVKNGSMRGLVLAAEHIRQKTNEEGKASNLTPIDKGNLNSSWFVATPTSTPPVKGSKKFSSDPVGSRVRAEHSGVVEQAKGEVKSMSSGSKKFLMMGYSAFYAGFVHEFIDPGIRWTRIGSNAKWFQNTIYSNKDKILKIIANESQIKG